MKRSTRLWFILGAFFLLGQVLYFAGLFFLKQYSIPTRSMEPTIRRGDRVVVLRTKDVRRGDLVSFKSPTDSSIFLMRAVGVGGDTVELRGHHLYLNGREIEENYVKYEDVPAGRYNFQPTRVPPSHLFVLGDNRNNANDSRYLGFIPLADVEGRAVYIMSLKGGFRRPAPTPLRTAPAPPRE